MKGKKYLKDDMPMEKPMKPIRPKQSMPVKKVKRARGRG